MGCNFKVVVAAASSSLIITYKTYEYFFKSNKNDDSNKYEFKSKNFICNYLKSRIKAFFEDDDLKTYNKLKKNVTQKFSKENIKLLYDMERKEEVIRILENNRNKDEVKFDFDLIHLRSKCNIGVDKLYDLYILNFLSIKNDLKEYQDICKNFSIRDCLNTIVDEKMLLINEINRKPSYIYFKDFLDTFPYLLSDFNNENYNDSSAQEKTSVEKGQYFDSVFQSKYDSNFIIYVRNNKCISVYTFKKIKAFIDAKDFESLKKYTYFREDSLSLFCKVLLLILEGNKSKAFLLIKNFTKNIDYYKKEENLYDKKIIGYLISLKNFLIDKIELFEYEDVSTLFYKYLTSLKLPKTHSKTNDNFENINNFKNKIGGLLNYKFLNEVDEFEKNNSIEQTRNMKSMKPKINQNNLLVKDELNDMIPNKNFNDQKFSFKYKSLDNSYYILSQLTREGIYWFVHHKLTEKNNLLLEKTLKLFPDDIRILFQAFNIYISIKKIDDVLKIINKMKKLFIKDPRTYICQYLWDISYQKSKKRKKNIDQKDENNLNYFKIGKNNNATQNSNLNHKFITYFDKNKRNLIDFFINLSIYSPVYKNLEKEFNNLIFSTEFIKQNSEVKNLIQAYKIDSNFYYTLFLLGKFFSEKNKIAACFYYYKALLSTNIENEIRITLENMILLDLQWNIKAEYGNIFFD